jgi:hypothetical protein
VATSASAKRELKGTNHGKYRVNNIVQANKVDDSSYRTKRARDRTPPDDNEDATMTSVPVNKANHFPPKEIGAPLSHGENLVSKFWGLDEWDDDGGEGDDEMEPRFGPTHNGVGAPYSKLEFPDSVRLLRIEGGKGSRLEIGLEVTRLSSLSVHYEAISYVWGSKERGVEIPTKTGTLRMTSNLRDSLLHLRLTDQPRYVWADAVCINQEDQDERGRQVQLMREIYKSAHRVILWLGPDTRRKAALAFSVLCSIASGGHLNGNPVGQANFYSNGISSAHIPDLACRDGPPPADFAALWDSVDEMFDNNWFWRMWCLQEVALAREALVVWGKAEISWNHVGLAAARIRTSYDAVLAKYRLAGVYNAYFMYRISQGVTELKPLRISFLALLTHTRQLESTDARDRIFGLLGIPTTDSDPASGNLFMMPDYFSSTLDIYLRFAEQVFRGRSGNPISLFRSVQHGDELDVSWPTWVPRWDRVYVHGLSPYDMEENTPAEQQSISSDGLGCIVPVKHASEVNCVRAKCIPPFGVQFLQDLDSSNRLLVDEENQKELCWTLTAGKDWYGLDVTNARASGHLDDFATYMRENFPHHWHAFERRSHGNSQRFQKAAANACDNRRLFWTKSGNWGLGPAAMKEGDVLVELSEQVPRSLFILRLNTEVKHWHLIGECYVFKLDRQKMATLKNGDNQFLIR